VKETRRMLVLYRELAGYFVHCMNHLATSHGVHIDIVAYPVNAEAPFEFSFPPHVKVYKRQQVDERMIEDWIKENHYNLIFCGGWTDSLYLKIVANHRSIPALVGFDKQWLGTLRDYFSGLYHRWKLRPLFDFAFVPGNEQGRYARAMGFLPHEIVSGAYACDVDRFYALSSVRRDNTCKQIWYVGRYVPQKDVASLFAVIQKVLADFPEWEFHAVGTGELFGTLACGERMMEHGFLQPSELAEKMGHGHVFILPSLYEPWGVVVHEFAAAGYAILTSDKVGARTAFVEPDKNGDVFPAGNSTAMESTLRKWMRKSNLELKEAGEHSSRLARQITPEKYAQALLRMMGASE
jgi:glycosyltransferase involved in cell wall biosynthesis